MLTAKYYKIANKWYFDYPQYIEDGGNPDNLERIGGMHDLLEFVAEGKSTVTLLLDFEPFEGADEGVLVASSGGNTGAYYQLHKLKGEVVDLEIWVDELIYLKNMELPEKIYGKPI
jgi:hypothetical protein